MRFLRCVPGYGYFRGDVGEVAEEDAERLVEAGLVTAAPAEEEAAGCRLPEDLPMRELLAANGFETLEQVAAAGEALMEIDGIGEKTMRKILAHCRER